MFDNKYSVLMSVYYKEKPEYLELAMKSMWEQTISPSDFVLVCDGPLNAELDNVIEKMQKKYDAKLQVLRLPQNVGLGNALNRGLEQCKNELVARMDSDDIARPDRCEKQLKIFENYPEVSICSGTVEEFEKLPQYVDARRILPETNQEILEFSKSRNPFNHPCVMYKKSDIEAAGSYQDFYLLEDYYLWIRMLIQGYKGYNISDPLLWMRAGKNMYKRRAGWKYAKSQVALFKYMRINEFISLRQYAKSSFVRIASSMAPNSIRQFLFKNMLRE